MTNLADIKPRDKGLVIDLVSKAGIDVSDWANFKGGTKKASTNPRYCYEWAFVEPGQRVVLNIRYPLLKESGDQITIEVNFREDAYTEKPGVRRARVKRMDDAVRIAFEQALPVRVILLDGKMRDRNILDAPASTVSKRSLDPYFWFVAAYDRASGKCKIVRKNDSQPKFIDQFLAFATSYPKQHSGMSTSFTRSAAVRNRVLIRSNGFCEFCGQLGFTTQDGKKYLETHHITPLSEGGSDNEINVVALCPNHHREAHFGKNAGLTRHSLHSLVRKQFNSA